jgi:hypothetical protein
VLEARIQIFRILPEDHHVDGDILEASLNAGQRSHRAYVREQVECLSELHVNALEPASNGCRHRSF